MSSRADCEREHCTVPLEFLSVLLLVFGGSVPDLGVGVRSAAAAPFCSFAGS